MRRSYLRTAVLAASLALAVSLSAATAQARVLAAQAPAKTEAYAIGQSRVTYPSSYDLRKLGKLPPVGDQGSTGTCWAFAALGSLESSMLPGDVEVFSADNLVLKTTGSYDVGRTPMAAAAYLARWAGPILDSQDAFGDGYTPPGLTPARHVQNVLLVPLRKNQHDNGTIKSALMKYGAVDVGMYFHEETYAGWQEFLLNLRSTWSPDHDAYYYNGSKGTDHAVDIVGWNDHYSRNNFATKPPGNGAFIVRNSWGTQFGDKGYFYVSYYDTRLARAGLGMVFNGAEPTNNFRDIYQYDFGPSKDWGASSDSAWMANDFTAAKSDLLNAVSFWTLVPNARYTLYAKTGSAKTLTAQGSGTLSLAGYHTVHLARPKQLVAGQRFRVAVKVTTPGDTTPIKLGPTLGPAGTKQSFVSRDGRAWTDVSKLAGDRAMSVCLKAFTRPATPTSGLAIGDAYGGGIVAYIDGSGQHGLIAATADQTSDSGIPWATAPNWYTSVPGALGTAIGTGAANTNAIIAQNGAGTSYAAGLARAYTGGGYTDWFLPSKEELNELYLNRVAIGGFNTSYTPPTYSAYWSSSQYADGADGAWVQYFHDGSRGYFSDEYVIDRVRAVRAF